MVLSYANMLIFFIDNLICAEWIKSKKTFNILDKFLDIKNRSNDQIYFVELGGIEPPSKQGIE